MRSFRQGQILALPVMLAALLAACGPATGVPSAPGDATSPAASPSAAAIPGGAIPHCDDVPRVSAPDGAYRPTPVYVANEQPTDELLDWASAKPAFESLWLDRERNGWVTLAFSADAAARQAELADEFPGVGVVAVEVPWTKRELEMLQERVIDELREIVEGSGTDETRGVVTIYVGPLLPERVAAVQERFAGERVCVEGTDPALVVPEGPQPREGDGWRLLAAERDAGAPYRTGIASDEASFVALWAEAGVSGERPPVDFVRHVVVWFGAVYGSGCAGLRLDDVVVDRARALVHGVIVLPGSPGACNSDANPHAFVVTVDRAKLPQGPFTIQLDAEGPPGGATEERTVVEIDLSRPGVTAGPGDVHAGQPDPVSGDVESGGTIETVGRWPYRLVTRCGVEWLGQLNDVWWRTEVPAGTKRFMPDEWTPLDNGDVMRVLVALRPGPEPHVEASANGLTVTYLPANQPAPPCD